MSRSEYLFFLAVVFCLALTSCSSRDVRQLPHVLPPTDQARISFVERTIPDDCQVFAHLLISVPAALPADQLRQAIEQFAADHGGDLVLLGLARQHTASPDGVGFQAYGPISPYSFEQKWMGWKFGFSDWNKGGPLVDLDRTHLTGAEAPFTIPVSLQAVLLSCPSVRNGS